MATLLSKKPPVIVTSPKAPDDATAPPDSSALLFLNVPPAIAISDAELPMQYSLTEHKTKKRVECVSGVYLLGVTTRNNNRCGGGKRRQPGLRARRSFGLLSTCNMLGIFSPFRPVDSTFWQAWANEKASSANALGVNSTSRYSGACR